MKKTLLLLLTFLSFKTLFSQSNFSFTNNKFFTTTYTDISNTGTTIGMTDAENGASVSPINIGFDFNFNGTVFTQATIHADGILRFGTTAPGSHAALFTNNASASGSVFTSATSSYQNIVLPLFMDLVQGSSTPQYHVLTQGSAPNRVTTIQWKNLRDNNNSGATTQSQFANLEFQVKLYETTNDIQVVYGTFTPSANVATGRNAQAGIKASSTQFIGVKKSNSATVFNASEFFNPAAHAVFPSGLPIRNNLAPGVGFSYIFYGQIAADINLAEAYVERFVTKTATAPTHNSIRVKNEGTTAITNIDVTMQVAGANTFSQTINIATLAAGSDQTVDFSGYSIANTGNQNITFSAVAAGDARAENNTLQKPQTVTNNYVQIYNDDENQTTGVGFNGTANNEIAIKMYGTGTRKISQIRLPFNSYLSNISIKLLEDDGGGNLPSTILHTSPVFRTNGDNEVQYNLPTPVTVTGDYYISVLQVSTENMGWQFALKYPVQPNRIYTGNGFTYALQISDRAYSNLAKVVEESSLPDVGIVQVTSPVCTYGTAPVTVALRNYSSAVHDFATNPVTITGSVVNSQTNTPIPFSIVKSTGTLAGGAVEPITVLAEYDFSLRALHRFIAKTVFAADAEPNNDSLNYAINNSLRNTKTFTDSVCPFTPVTLTATANIYTNILWNVNGAPSSGATVSLSPATTTVVKVTATDYRGCTIIDSFNVLVKANGLPPSPVITFSDTLLRYSNGFKDTLSVSPLAGHTINWIGSSTPINDGANYIVSGFRGIDIESHQAYYRNTATGCGGNATSITTRFAAGILLNNNTTETVCDTSFYDAGGAFNPNQGSNNFTKTFLPATPGKKIKLSIYNLSLGQFSIMDVYDGTNTSAARLEQLSRTSDNTIKEYMASNNDGAITVSFRANSSTSSGWLAGITCEEPLQFRSVQNGLFTVAANWESKLPAATVYTPATRSPSKGDDTILIRHAISVASGKSLPLDQTIIEPAGTLTIPANTNVILYSDNQGNDLTVKGTLTANGNIFGSPNSSLNGKIALEGTLNLLGSISIDSFIVTPSASPAIINATGNPNIGKLQVNNAAGLNINGSLDITQSLHLVNGVVKVASPGFVRLNAGNGPEIVGGSANSYIDGRLRWQKFNSSEPFAFPVGKNGIYRKIELTTDQNSFDFSVEYEAELFAQAPPARTLPSTFTNINQQWYHTVKITAGASNFSEARATIYYEASDGISDPSVLRIGKDDGGANWLDVGGEGTGTPAGSITSNSFTSFSDFVLANITGGPLPVTLVDFSGTTFNQSVQLNWKVENEANFATYVVERSIDGFYFTSAGNVTANGAASYKFADLQLPTTDYIYYRLKMVDKDGSFSYSKVIRVSLSSILKSRMITIAPNPFVNTLSIQYKSLVGQSLQIQILDAAGKVLKSNRYSLLPGNNQLQFNAGELPKGTYLLKMSTNNNTVTEKIIKN